jgi:hypothetical protein
MPLKQHSDSLFQEAEEKASRMLGLALQLNTSLTTLRLGAVTVDRKTRLVCFVSSTEQGTVMTHN